MGSEHELKIAVDDLAALRRRLRAQGARLVLEEGFEDNTVWDRGDELRRAGCMLRLRTDARGSRLTYKGPPSFDGPLKTRLEHETELAGPAAAAILEELGYAPVRRYQKRRESWDLDGVLVALDKTPMGDFVEFEGRDARQAAERCGCDPGESLDGDYLALWEAYRERHPEAPAEMVFDPPEGRGG